MSHQDFQNKNQTIGNGFHIHAGTELQSQFKEIEVDTTTASLVPVDLLSVNFHKSSSNSRLKVYISTSSSNDTNATSNRFQLVVDGVAVRGCGCRGQNNFAQAAAMIHVIDSLSAGDHTIKVQWFVSGGTGQIRPITHADDESASMLIEEVLQP
jgi:hypothetical protein